MLIQDKYCPHTVDGLTSTLGIWEGTIKNNLSVESELHDDAANVMQNSPCQTPRAAVEMIKHLYDRQYIYRRVGRQHVTLPLESRM
jgi:hypothetical protein